MSIEFFRTECKRPVDDEGFELPPWLNPHLSIPDPPPVWDEPTEESWAEYLSWCQQCDEENEYHRYQEECLAEAKARFG